MEKLKTWQKVLTGVLLLLLLTAVVVLAYAYWPLTEDLSHLAAVGDEYDVRILRDTWGVPHIYGQSDPDVAYGLAYAHAEDDFLTIQQTLAAARGELGRLYGRDAAPNDYMVHLLRIDEVVTAGYPTLPTDVQALVQGYADGLNHYAALHPEDALPGLFPVTGQDVVAGFVHKTPLFFGVDGVLTELFAEERQRPVSEKTTTQNGQETPRTSKNSPFIPHPSSFSSHPFVGSNTFAVSPDRSAEGQTFLAVNSHQPWEGPVTWYEAHLHSEEGWNITGGLFPGAPTILHGHNPYLGWAFTVNSPDLVDVYVLDINPDNPNQYRFDGEWRDLEVRQAPITVKLFGRFTWTVNREVLWSVYGPTVRRPHGVYAVRFVGYGDLGLVEQWYRMNKATTFDEWQAAMREGALPMFNAGYADREGNIYYLYNARLPLRAEGYEWEQYLPGDTSDTLWTEYLPFDELPQVLNPPSGFIQNGNSTPYQTTIGPGNPDPDDFSVTFGIETHMSNRALRALELFGADESITEEAFIEYKYDRAYSPDSAVAAILDQLRSAPPQEDADTAQALSILADWDLQTTPDSEGATLMVLMLYFLNETEGSGVDPSHLTDTDADLEMLLDSLGEATAVLTENFGRVDIPWQEVNRLQRGDVDMGLGGGPDVLHAVYGELQEDGRLRGFVGDSYILIVTWDTDGAVHSQSIHQYGSATLNEDSPHYADQAPLFVNRELKPVWLDEADIRANLEAEYRPGEE